MLPTACNCRAAGARLPAGRRQFFNPLDPRASGGQPQVIEPLARAAVAVGIAGVFVEVHDAPERALSDGANALRLDRLPEFWRRLCALDGLVKSIDSTR